MSLFTEGNDVSEKILEKNLQKMHRALKSADFANPEPSTFLQILRIVYNEHELKFTEKETYRVLPGMDI